MQRSILPVVGGMNTTLSLPQSKESSRLRQKPLLNNRKTYSLPMKAQLRTVRFSYTKATLSQCVNPQFLTSKVLEKRAELEPSNAYPHRRLATIYESLGRDDDARREQRMADSLDSRGRP